MTTLAEHKAMLASQRIPRLGVIEPLLDNIADFQSVVEWHRTQSDPNLP
jgi:hypothetical protein